MTTGAWIKGSDLTGITKAKIVNEAEPQTSQFKNKDGSPKMQDVCKVRFEGKDEAFNLSLNKTTINGLIEAFGDDSKNWMNKILGVETEKVRVAGKAAVAIYLIPDGYKKIDNDEGFAEIVKIGSEDIVEKDQNIPIINEDQETDASDIPF